MADQGAVNLFMVVSMIALWVMVAGLTGIHIAEYLKKRTRMRAVILDSRGEARDEHELGKQKELLIGKTAPANLVNIDFSDSAYAASI